MPYIIYHKILLLYDTTLENVDEKKYKILSHYIFSPLKEVEITWQKKFLLFSLWITPCFIKWKYVVEIQQDVRRVFEFMEYIVIQGYQINYFGLTHPLDERGKLLSELYFFLKYQIALILTFMYFDSYKKSFLCYNSFELVEYFRCLPFIEEWTK